MNTYVMGEIATLLVISVLAGMLIGWCIKSLFAGRNEKKVRNFVARDIDEAQADVESLRAKLSRKEEQLITSNQELQKLRGRDLSMKAGNTSQIDEINKLKNELAVARQSLDRNRTEFNSYRNDSQKEVQGLNNQLARFTAGGPVYDERMSEAGETISALRNATRENDRVIDSLRARVKEADSTVENLRNQLRTKEASVNELEQAQQNVDATVGKLNTQLHETTAQRDQLQRDYDITLANKNAEIGKLQTRLEELGKTQTELKQTEHELNKQRTLATENADRSQQQIAELKQAVSQKDAEHAAQLKEHKSLQSEIARLQADKQRLSASANNELQKVKQQFVHTQEKLQTVQGEHNKTLEQLRSANSLQTQVENKSAEVVALNDMLRNVSNKRNELQAQVRSMESQLQLTEQQRAEQQASQKKLVELTKLLHQRDTTIAKLKKEFDEVAQSRNQLGIELGDLQSRTEEVKTRIKTESEQQITQLATALKDRDQSFDKLRQDMDQMTVSRDRLTAELNKLQTRGAELENFKSDMQTAVANRDSELEQRTQAYQKLQSEFTSLSKIRDDYETRIDSLKNEIQTQAQRLKEQEETSRQEIDSLRPQISDLRAKLSLADSENQKIRSELSEAASLKLALTEKDAAIQKLQIDVQDAKLSGSGSDEKTLGKIDSLTEALRARDEEISRLNSAITENRLASKQSQSDATLLKQEIDSQQKLIKDLEERSESTLELHKKIAAQSTEIEELRARLYQGEATETPSDAAGKNEVQALRAQLAEKSTAYDTLNKQLQQVNSKFQASQPKQAAATAASTPSPAKDQVVANGNSSTKPRVFVRPDQSQATTDALAGVSSMNTQKRVAYTRDGYRIKHTDGRDNLGLLPGISKRTELELNKHGVSDFEQITLWGKREVLHFAERSGIAPSQAESYDWPKLAGEILRGTYRRDEYLESDSK